MTDLSAGLVGAAAGLLLALLGNLVVLPYVLKQQDKKIATDYRAPIFGWDKQRTASLTRLMYRVQMPILFAFVGAVSAIQVFGGSE
jgi:Na+-driven multidrug efflux pump